MRILTLTKLPCLFAEQLILNSSWDLPYRDYLDSFGLALHVILLTLYLVQEMSHSMNPFLWSLYFQHCIDTIPVNHCFFNKEFYYSTVTVAAYTCQVKRLHCMVKKKKKKILAIPSKGRDYFKKVSRSSSNPIGQVSF